MLRSDPVWWRGAPELKVIEGLDLHCRRHGIADINEIVGTAA